MCRDGTQGAARAARRITRWQNTVKTEPIQREMSRLKATPLFRTRERSFAEQLQGSIQPEVTLHRFAREGYSNYDAESFAAFCTKMIGLGVSPSVMRDMMGQRPALVGREASITDFVTWLFQRVHTLRKSLPPQTSLCLKDLPARRMHLVGSGSIGKNFPFRPRQVAGYARHKSSMLAFGLFRHWSTMGMAQDLPRVITQAANHRNRENTHAAKISCNSSMGDNHNTHGSSQKKVCHFFRLPPELRNRIYEYIFGYDLSEEVDLLTADSPTSALPRTCKQIGRECGLMYLRNFQQFWLSSRFYIDASVIPIGWHTRHMLLRLPIWELEKIKNLRISFVAKNGVYNAVKKEDHWLVKRVGGPHQSGWGACRNNLWGADELVLVLGHRFRVWTPFRPSSLEYDFQAVNASLHGDIWLKYHRATLESGFGAQVPVRGQICAIIEELHRFT